MRILYFHQHFSTPEGAAGVRSYFFARKLVEKQHQVTMVCGSYGVGQTGLTGDFQNGRREGVVDGIRVIEFDLAYSNHDGLLSRTTKFALFALRSVRLAIREDYDIAFATSTPLTAAIPGIASKLLRRRTFVFEVRDLWPELPHAMGVIKNRLVLMLMAALEWSAYKAADGCIALSPGIQKGIQRYGKPSEEVTMIPNGCDIGLFDGDDERSEIEGVRPADSVAIFAGTHGQANGLDSVLAAAECLKRRGRDDIKIVLVGDGKLKPVLVSRAEEQGLSNVVFLAPVSKGKLAGLFKRADVGLQILRNVPEFYYGTSPNKFFDYLSAGLPVVTNYPGWIADLIGQSQCGIAVDPDAPELLADALERAVESRQWLEQAGRNARTLAESRFDRADLAEDFATFLMAVHRRRRPART